MSATVFHPGEREAQARAGVAAPHAAIRDWMPDQHRDFFRLLPFVPLAVPDPDGAPAATILTGPPGFIGSPDAKTLRIDAAPDPKDRVAPLLREGAAIGLLGIDLGTRRRNRANGIIRAVAADALTVSVNQSFGNCPQYIQTRSWQSAPAQLGQPEHLSRLNEAARTLIRTSDTFFVATASGPAAGAQGGMDISHRGGRPGFVAVRDNTLLIPDFRGNRYFNTLGNLLLDPRTALLFVDWGSGALLHVQGRVEILWNDTGGFQGAERLWRVSVTSAWYRGRALPLRWSFQSCAPQTQNTGSWSEAPPHTGV